MLEAPAELELFRLRLRWYRARRRSLAREEESGDGVGASLEPREEVSSVLREEELVAAEEERGLAEGAEEEAARPVRA